MKKFYKHHILPKSYGIALAILCWTFAALQLMSNINIFSEKNIPAFLETEVTTSGNYIYSDKYFAVKQINNSTFELLPLSNTKILDALNSFVKQYDNSVKLTSYHNAGNYDDYYLYSKVLDKNGITPLTQGCNLHIAITKSPLHIYMGIPCIDYDF